MKPKSSVSYFPVQASEQALLLRVREDDLRDRIPEVAEMLDRLAEAGLTLADLDQAIELLAASRQSETLDARFQNLEARLKERIGREIAEMEGRLSRRLSEHALRPVVDPAPPRPAPVTPPAPKPSTTGPTPASVPPDANVAFRIGDEVVWGPKAAHFYASIWKWLFTHGYVQPDDLPIVSGKRFAAARQPIHPNGKEFIGAREILPGVFIEVNLSRPDIIHRARKYLDHYGVRYEVLVGNDA